jgi:hypothetical protein
MASAGQLGDYATVPFMEMDLGGETFSKWFTAIPHDGRSGFIA